MKVGQRELFCEARGCVRLGLPKGWGVNGQRLRGRYCEAHGNEYHKRRTRAAGYWRRGEISNVVCEGCGWEGRCDRHRLDEELGYVAGNVRVLCAGCHRKAHKEKVGQRGWTKRGLDMEVGHGER
jgi:hypothetical protein